MQHNKYPNVFALGDVANLPTAKTAAAVFSQAPVVSHNIVQMKKAQELNANYDGYSSCPLFTGDGKLMLMEFKYGGEPSETFSKNQDKPASMYYAFKKWAFPIVYWQFMPRGLWYGKNMIFRPRH